MTITGFCSRLSWERSPCKGRCQDDRRTNVRLEREAESIHLLVGRRPPISTDDGGGPLLPPGYLESQQFRPLPRCSLIGPLRTSAHTNFTITGGLYWASRENLRARTAQHRLARSISAVSRWFSFYYLIPLHLQIAIGRGCLWVNHTRRDKEERTVEEMAGTNGRWLRTA